MDGIRRSRARTYGVRDMSNTLDPDAVGMIKTILAVHPNPTNQAILS